MLGRLAVAALALAAAACEQQQGQMAAPGGGGDALTLESPAPEAEPSRVFSPVNAGARTATGDLTVAISTELAGEDGAELQEVLTLRGANGLVVEGQITSAALSPATQVNGQTLRALLSLPVEEARVLVYRVVSETKPASGQGVCEAGSPSFVVFWEPSDPGASGLKLLGVMDGAPGAAGARPCPMLEYRRS